MRTVLVWALLSSMIRWSGDLVHFCCRAIAAPSRAFTRIFPIAHTINWARSFTTCIGQLGAIGRLAALTTTDLFLRDRERLGLYASTTADFLCFPIATIHLHNTSLGAHALAESTPGAFAIFGAARQVTGSGVNVAVFVVAIASTWGGGDINLENSTLFATWATFCATWTITTVGTLTPILPVALTINLAWFCAARMELLSAGRLGASFAPMGSLCGDTEHAFLDSPTTSG